MKSGMQTQILVLRTVTWQSIKVLQIKNGGRPSYWKSFFSISRFIVRLMQNLVWAIIMTKIPNFVNSRCRTAAILKMILLSRAKYQNLQIQYCGRPCQRFIVRLMRNLYMRKHDHVWHRSLNQIPNFENSRWRTAAILKIVLLLRLGRGSSDFNEIWCRCKF